MTTPPTTATIGESQVDFALDLGIVLHGRQNGIDLGNLDDEAPIERMFIDPDKLAEAIWANFDTRLIQAGLETQDAFFRSFNASARRSCESAMKEAIKDFFSWGSSVIAEVEKRIAALGQPSDPFGPLSTAPPESSAPPSSDT